MTRYTPAALVFILMGTVSVSAQEALPEMSIRCNGSAVVVHNGEEQVLQMNSMSFMWNDDRSEIGWNYKPEHPIGLKPGESRGIRYSEIIKDYDAEADHGLPWSILVSVTKDARHPAILCFTQNENDLYVLDEKLSMVLTPAEQRRRMQNPEGK